MKIFISGAHGSACSFVKSQFLKLHTIDRNGTCHEAWNSNITKTDLVLFDHWPNINTIHQNCKPNVTIWIRIAQENIVQIINRIVILDFLYTNNNTWVEKDWCWTEQKHDRIAGRSWPTYSTDISSYPTWCLNEMCEVAYERSKPWLADGKDFDYVIDSRDLFSFQEPITLRNTLNSLEYTLDENFLNAWRNKNYLLWQEHKHRFSWHKDESKIK